jgi:hypothetical protein
MRQNVKNDERSAAFSRQKSLHLARVLRLAYVSASAARFEDVRELGVQSRRLKPHQSLDPMQSTRDIFGGQGLPDTPGSIGVVTCRRLAQTFALDLFIASTPPAARTRQQCIVSASRFSRVISCCSSFCWP